MSISAAECRETGGSARVFLMRLSKNSFWPFGDRATARAAAKLYETAVRQSRQPGFYTSSRVPDTVDGRFDMITLHVFLIVHRLKSSPAETAKLAQAVFDTMFNDMDQNLREMGVGDLGVSRRIKVMVSAFYGRIAAYEAALAADSEDEDALARAIGRNIYPETPKDTLNPGRMAAYLSREASRLAGQPLDALVAGKVAFGPPPAPINGTSIEKGEQHLERA
jgi:cytochrome b pre-mRNA-processing protein 3